MENAVELGCDAGIVLSHPSLARMGHPASSRAPSVGRESVSHPNANVRCHASSMAVCFRLSVSHGLHRNGRRRDEEKDNDAHRMDRHDEPPCYRRYRRRN